MISVLPSCSRLMEIGALKMTSYSPGTGSRVTSCPGLFIQAKPTLTSHLRQPSRPLFGRDRAKLPNWANVFEDGPPANANAVDDGTRKVEVFVNLDAKLIATNL
jgi:hypothetical protein